MSEETERQLAHVSGGDALLVTDARSTLVARARRDMKAFLPEANDPLFQLRQQAQRGDADAQVKLGDEYSSRCGWCHACSDGKPCQEHGPGTVYHEYHREAAVWYLKAAEQGNREGQYALGSAYRRGSGVPKDPSEAVKWYLKAADQRHLYAIDELGDMYEAGEGVPQNSSEALRYFTMATEDDVDPDYWDPDAILSMWRKAAEYGCSRAQLLHGDSRVRSAALSLEHRMIDRYMWYELAAANGEAEGTTFRDALAVKMSEAQIAEAQRRVREWKPKM